jgi:hypothetical protein
LPDGVRSLCFFRIGAEVAEQDVFLAGGGDFQIAGLPERVEVRQSRGVCAGAVAAALVQMAKPRVLVAALRVGLGDAEPFRQIAEDGEVVARLADRCNRLLHRHDELVAARAADVVALERRGGRQHDIGVARGCGPPRLVHDDGLGLLPGAAELVGVLMMVEWIAAGPIDQLDVGIVAALAVEVVSTAGIEQAVGDARRGIVTLTGFLMLSIAGAANDSGASPMPAPEP